MRPPASSAPSTSFPSALRVVLHRAKELGYLGPGDIEAQYVHAERFARTVEPPKRAVDLGSGGGVPGLVLAGIWLRSEWVLLDAMQRRCAFLTAAVDTLGLGDRVRVRNERSETAGHDVDLRHRADLVTARGFGAPQLTAESAAPLLVDDGYLVVSEPPEGGGADRWPAVPLAELGLRCHATWQVGSRYRVLRKVGETPARYPRSPKAQQRQPLWGEAGKRTA